MAVQITIRNVPEEVRDELRSRAAAEGKSMQQFLREVLERMVAKPSIETWLEEVREINKQLGIRVTAAEIPRARDEDRK